MPGPLTLGALAEGAPSILLPSWMDTMAMLQTCDYASTTVTLGTTADELCAPADPQRWAIGFSGSFAAAMWVAPFTPALNVGFQLTATSRITDGWFSIFVFGPMVGYQWFRSGSVNDVLTVHTVTVRR